MTPREEYDLACENLRRSISGRHVFTTVDLTVICLSEVRTAICVAGLGDQELIRDLISVQYRLADLIKKPEEASGES